MEAVAARKSFGCPFTGQQCTKRLHKDDPSGVCTYKQVTGLPVICCPTRLYANDYQVLRDVAEQAFGGNLNLVRASEAARYRAEHPGNAYIVVFGRRWGKELRLPNRSKRRQSGGNYFIDWILVHVDSTEKLLSFVALEVQTIDTSGNYRAGRTAALEGRAIVGKNTAGFNWENVFKRILPQLIYKGHVLRREPLCQKGLFFVCPAEVQSRLLERLGGSLAPIHQQPGSVTFMWYDVGPDVPDGQIRSLEFRGRSVTTIEQLALAFTAPTNLPPAQVYEQAINLEL